MDEQQILHRQDGQQLLDARELARRLDEKAHDLAAHHDAPVLLQEHIPGDFAHKGREKMASACRFIKPFCHT